MSGYFHYHSKNQVLTAYYEISSKYGILSFSSSLWKKSTKQEHWNRRKENNNAFKNYMNCKIAVLFKPFEQGDLKLDDVWLKTFIHKVLTRYGRINQTIQCEIGDLAFKTIEECHKSRGHTYYSRKDLVKNLQGEFDILEFILHFAIAVSFLTSLMSVLFHMDEMPEVRQYKHGIIP